MELNKIYCGDCIEVMKQFEDNIFDAVITDPPYFLINTSGSGFMGKEWESLNSSKFYDIIWKSKEFVRNVIRHFIPILIKHIRGDIVLLDVGIKINKGKRIQIIKEAKLKEFARFVAKYFIAFHPKSKEVMQYFVVADAQVLIL